MRWMPWDPLRQPRQKRTMKANSWAPSEERQINNNYHYLRQRQRYCHKTLRMGRMAVRQPVR